MKTAREPITAEPVTAAATTGRADVRFDARDKATGVTRYSADLPVPGALEVVLVRSPLPHAEITGVAASHVAYDLVSLLALRHEETLT